MAETTSRHGLPMLQAGQAQKEVTHNEALVMLDLLAHPAVEALGAVTPPAAPEPGQAWIVGPDASGAWAGQEGALALWTAGGWRFAQARAGMLAWVKPDSLFAWFDGSAWRRDAWPAAGLLINGQAVVGPRAGAISEPSGGSVMDVEARATLAQVLAVLRMHGLIAAG